MKTNGLKNFMQVQRKNSALMVNMMLTTQEHTRMAGDIYLKDTKNL